MAGIPCTVEIASEYRYRSTAITPGTLIVTLSQSGETADTLAALHYAKSLGHRISLCICNVPESALVRDSDLCFLTQAGPEIGVASTKAFTTQLVALMLLAMVLAKLNGRLPAKDEALLLFALQHLPIALQQVLSLEAEIRVWAERIAHFEHALFLGRGANYPIALEGALKLKEISYIHAEAFAAGELKHGPLALVTKDMPVIAIAPKDALFEKLHSNLQEVHARGGQLHVLTDHDTDINAGDGIHVIRMPKYSGVLSPILHTVPLQLLAYYAALARNNDVDKPRNLAKSVTVE
jgi:glucosamine--fructose-6-phosphate aminotransferase (isomerizing)